MENLRSNSKPNLWTVHKFGGTSVANSERYRKVAQIVRSQSSLSGNPTRQAVVVSAMSKVTDALIELTELAVKQDDSYLAKLKTLLEKHVSTLVELIPAGGDFVERLHADFRMIEEVLRAAWLTRTCSERTVELIAGHGEIWSAQLLCNYLNSLGVNATWLDAREVLVVNPGESSVAVDWEVSQAKADAWFAKRTEDFIVITGFVASSPDGIPTTLKRNGSDFSGSIFGKLLQAREIIIWTDVDGVLSADPRLVPEAVVLDELSYQEASELAYFGAKVVHPATMSPAIEDGIPIWIRNTFKPTLPGSRIGNTSPAKKTQTPIKGFATIDGMALVNVEGTGMIGVPGVAQRIFGALREVGVSVVMISQASSEHSICFAIPSAQAALAKKTVEHAFFAELHHGQIQTVDVSADCSILAAVGDAMVDHPGVAGKFFGALGKAGVNIRAIAQGSSERNISAVVDRVDSQRALRAVHSAFYLSHQTLSVGLIGPGLIGGTLLDQLSEQAEKLRRDFKIDLRVRGILSSKKMFLNEQSIELKDWKKTWSDGGEPADLDRFISHIKADHLPHAVIIDATSSGEIPKFYPKWIRRGLHLITPNKKANTMSIEFYRELAQSARERGRHYLYETTVGAGLPIINTLRDLVQTGDRVEKIEGILSGTLSYIFNTYDGTRAFSEVVLEAKARGYTEPDPRDDLSGRDVARKLVILAREMGLGVELSDVQIESLVPESLRDVGVDEFLKQLPQHDTAMKSLLAKGEVLRYVGKISEAGKLSVSLSRYPSSHAFARLSGSDNIVAFTTARYHSQPLIVQGPGAGPQVTAAGVFGDLLRLASYLGTSS